MIFQRIMIFRDIDLNRYLLILFDIQYMLNNFDIKIYFGKLLMSFDIIYILNNILGYLFISILRYVLTLFNIRYIDTCCYISMYQYSLKYIDKFRYCYKLNNVKISTYWFVFFFSYLSILLNTYFDTSL